MLTSCIFKTGTDVSNCFGQGEVKRGSQTRSRVNPDLPSVTFHNPFAYRQSDTGAGDLRIAMQTLEDAEDLFIMSGPRRSLQGDSSGA